METLIDIRHCLKILLVIVLVSNILIGVSGENEDFTIDSLPTNEKAVIPRLRSPQLIPDRNIVLSPPGRKIRRRRPKKLCKAGEFWHSRGLKCVLKRCPEGTARRNINDGQCVEESKLGERRVRMFSGNPRYSGPTAWNRKKKVVYHGLPPRFGPNMEFENLRNKEINSFK